MALFSSPVTVLTYVNSDFKVLSLHQSTGRNIWYGDEKTDTLMYFKKSICMVPRLLKEYSDQYKIKISIEERILPKGNSYPQNNYPYDYYNLWVKHTAKKPYFEEPTLEMLTEDYDVIVFKHCFPVSKILRDDKCSDIDSEKKTLLNYKLQYMVIKEKLLELPKTKFIGWTGPALVKLQTNEAEAKRVKEFAGWVKNDWNTSRDNIDVFDFSEIETEEGLYLKPEYATSIHNSHPNKKMSIKVAKLLVNRILDVIFN